jgi:hypothetical protein
VVNSAMSLYPQSAVPNVIGSCWRQDSMLLDPARQQDPTLLSPVGGKKKVSSIYFPIYCMKKN